MAKRLCVEEDIFVNKTVSAESFISFHDRSVVCGNLPSETNEAEILALFN